ncbi:spore germination protein [Metabacillus sp. RGM 3146]|uniref:spore germination protein n=1 Tax=Metabacillus sp. RGM 3146 TaxID=3401092 RepID=UPI003B9BC8F9
MPAITGPGKIDRLRYGALTIGDAFAISPKVSERFYFGSGSSVSGDRVRMVNEKNHTYSKNSSISSQSQTSNA